MRGKLFQISVSLWASIVLLTAQGMWAGTIEGRVSQRNVDLSDAVVSVDDINGPYPIGKEAATKIMDQKGLRFVPHVLPILVGTTVDFPNSDPVLHNVFSVSECKRFNLGLYRPGTKRTIRFDQPGVVELLCNVHLEMSAYIVVLKNRYFSLTGIDGAYRIVGVPAGRHRLRCWHEPASVQEEEINVPAEGTVKVDFDMSSGKEHGTAPRDRRNFGD